MLQNFSFPGSIYFLSSLYFIVNTIFWNRQFRDIPRSMILWADFLIAGHLLAPLFRYQNLQYFLGGLTGFCTLGSLCFYFNFGQMRGWEKNEGLQKFFRGIFIFMALLVFVGILSGIFIGQWENGIGLAYFEVVIYLATFLVSFKLRYLHRLAFRNYLFFILLFFMKELIIYISVFGIVGNSSFFDGWASIIWVLSLFFLFQCFYYFLVQSYIQEKLG